MVPGASDAERRMPDSEGTTAPHLRLGTGRAVRLCVPRELNGERLDRALAQMIPAVSRSYLKKLAKDGFCLRNGRPVSPSDTVHSGDVIVVHLTKPIEPPCHREDGPLDIRYEDDHVLVVNKPVGMVCHPAKGHHVCTLLNFVVGHLWEEIQRGWARPHLANRLDKKTSGLVLVGKTPLAHRALQRQMDRRQIGRTYLALVLGNPGRAGIFDGHVSTVVPTGSQSSRPLTKSARTTFRTARVFVVEPDCPIAAVHVRLGTGRTHQIRVHFAEAGHPVLGEDTYAPPGVFDCLPPPLLELLATHRGYALHAMRLQFVHPANSTPMVVNAPPPRTFQQILRWLHLSSMY